MLKLKCDDKIKPILEKFIKDIEHNPDILKVILFGSQARGDYKDESDIDLLIVINEGLDDDMMRWDMEDVIDYKADIIADSPDWFKTSSNLYGTMEYMIARKELLFMKAPILRK